MAREEYKKLMKCNLLIKCKDCDMMGLCRECWRKEEKSKQQSLLQFMGEKND